ncbi:MAG: hypothetical protein IT385_18645 [Deltaproteobacteria bacterium]|nr:hypothetical protein [Deltaproteobacteria bacterium]
MSHRIAVLDVDLTLIENEGRTRALLVDFVGAHAGGDAALVARARSMPIAFSIRDNVAALGLDEALQRAALGFWRDAFFDPARLVHDTALPGAAEAVGRLVAAGTTVVYLTARPATLAAATVESMRALGFPVAEPGAVLVTKPDRAQGDEAYKRAALAWIGRLGEVVLCADNEPAHCNAMHEAFPAATTVHVDTRHSRPAPALLPAIRRVAALLEAIP